MKKKYYLTWLGAAALIMIDQGIKLIINARFLDRKFAILPPILYFEPMFNRYYSWFNSMLQFGASKWFHIVIVAFMTVVIALFYRFVHRRFGNHRVINIMFAFILAGAICSLIDKVFWDGSLDYIYLNGFFTFDLKDIYVNVFIITLVAMLIFKNEIVTKLTEGEVYKDFFRYLFKK